MENLRNYEDDASTELEQKEIHIQSVRNRIVRDSIKQQFQDYLKDYNEYTDGDPDDWKPDITEIMEQLGVHDGNPFHDALKDFVEAHAEIITDPVRTEVFEQRKEQRELEKTNRALKAALTPTTIG